MNTVRHLCIFLLNSEEQSEWVACKICGLPALRTEKRSGESGKEAMVYQGKGLGGSCQVATVRWWKIVTPGYTLKLELPRFADGLDVGCERRKSET